MDPDDENICRVSANKKGELDEDIICPLTNEIKPLYFSHSDNSINFITRRNAIYTLKDQSYVFHQFPGLNALRTLQGYNFYDSAWVFSKFVKANPGMFLVYGDIVLYESSIGHLSIYYLPFEHRLLFHIDDPTVVFNLNEMVNFPHYARLKCTYGCYRSRKWT